MKPLSLNPFWPEDYATQKHNIKMQKGTDLLALSTRQNLIVAFCNRNLQTCLNFS